MQRTGCTVEQFSEDQMIMATWECESRGAYGFKVNACPDQGQNLMVMTCRPRLTLPRNL